MASDAELFAWCAAGAKVRVERVARQDALAALARGEFDSIAEMEDSLMSPEPTPFSHRGEDIRVYVAKHGHKWKAHVREKWLLHAEMLDAGAASDHARTVYAVEKYRRAWEEEGLAADECEERDDG